MLLVDNSKVQYLSVLSSNFHASSPVLPTAITCNHIRLGRDVIDMTKQNKKKYRGMQRNVHNHKRCSNHITMVFANSHTCVSANFVTCGFQNPWCTWTILVRNADKTFVCLDYELYCFRIGNVLYCFRIGYVL